MDIIADFMMIIAGYAIALILIVWLCHKEE